MIGTLQSSNFFALKESPLRAVNVDDELQSISGATSAMSYGFAAPGDTEAHFVGLFGPYVVTPLQLDLPGSETYTWTLDPAGQELLGLSMSSGGEVSGDITDSIEHIFTDFDNYNIPNLGELPPNGEYYGYWGGLLVVYLRARASGGPNSGYYQAALLIYPLIRVTGSLTVPDEEGGATLGYDAKHYPDGFNTAEGVGFGLGADPIGFPGSNMSIIPLVERITGSGWRMRVYDSDNIEYVSGFSSSPYGTFNVTRTTGGYTGGSGTFTVAQAS